MIEKIIYADDYLETGEPAVRLLNINPGGEIIKTAYALPVETVKFIESISPTPGKSYLLINALGASGILYKGGIWGQNRNADYFAEADLIDTQSAKEAMKNPGDKKGVRLKRYKTFENGHFFPNHSNKDPNKAIGKVLFADYDIDMHRVLLIVEFWRSKDRMLAGMIDRDIPISTSMGCRVPGDYCTICGNYSRKPDRSDACIHVREMRGKILEDGRRVGMINKEPRFFDISHVVVGADATSKVLMKVASSNWEKYAKYAYVMPKYYHIPKIASQKTAQINKELPPDEINGKELVGLEALIQATRNAEPTIPNKVLDSIPILTNMEKVGALVGMGIIPHEEELKHLGVTEEDLANVEPFYNEKIASSLAGYIPLRTIYEPFVTARLISVAKDDNMKLAVFDGLTDNIKHLRPSFGSMFIAGALFGKIAQALQKKLHVSYPGRFPMVNPALLALGAVGVYGVGKSLYGTAPAPNTVNSGQILPNTMTLTKLSYLYASKERTKKASYIVIPEEGDIAQGVYLEDLDLADKAKYLEQVRV